MLKANRGRSEFSAFAWDRVGRAWRSMHGYWIGMIMLSVCLVVMGQEAFGQSAREELQSTINQVIEVLKTIESRDDIAKSKPILRQMIARRFDFPAMAQDSLGDRWNELNGREDEFVSAFTDFLEAAYMGTLGSYRGEETIYNAERMNRDFAEVDTQVVGGRGPPIKVQYRLHLKEGAWKVFDVVIDHVSLVNNYRVQFRRILRTSSLQDLITKMRATVSSP